MTSSAVLVERGGKRGVVGITGVGEGRMRGRGGEEEMTGRAGEVVEEGMKSGELERSHLVGMTGSERRTLGEPVTSLAEMSPHIGMREIVTVMAGGGRRSLLVGMNTSVIGMGGGGRVVMMTGGEVSLVGMIVTKTGGVREGGGVALPEMRSGDLKMSLAEMRGTVAMAGGEGVDGKMNGDHVMNLAEMTEIVGTGMAGGEEGVAGRMSGVGMSLVEMREIVMAGEGVVVGRSGDRGRSLAGTTGIVMAGEGVDPPVEGEVMIVLIGVMKVTALAEEERETEGADRRTTGLGGTGKTGGTMEVVGVVKGTSGGDVVTGRIEGT